VIEEILSANSVNFVAPEGGLRRPSIKNENEGGMSRRFPENQVAG
jgi:hypothetical protein